MFCEWGVLFMVESLDYKIEIFSFVLICKYLFMFFVICLFLSFFCLIFLLWWIVF